MSSNAQSTNSTTSTTFDTLMEQGKLQFQQKLFDEALQTYTRALPLAPEQKLYLVHSNRAGCLLQLPNREMEALHAAKNCLDLNPRFVKGYHRMALAFIRLNDFEGAMEILVKLFQWWTTAPKSSFTEPDALAELDIFAEAFTRSLRLEVKEEEMMMLAGLRQYHPKKLRSGKYSPAGIASAMLQAQRCIAVLRNNGWFAKSQPEFFKRLEELLEDVTESLLTKNPGAHRDRDDYVRSKWSILWADEPPTRALLETRTGLKFPSPAIQEYHCMRPHVAVNPRLTVADVEKWYGDVIKGMLSQETIDKMTNGAVFNELSVLQKIRLYPGRQPDWWQWYAQHQKVYRGAFEEFQQVCEDCSIFDVYTKEFVDAFVDYLATRCKEILKHQDEIVIAEVGAGDGRLYKYVTNAFNRVVGALGKQVKFCACDMNSNDFAAQKEIPISIMEYEEFLECKNPSIVLCSWMPQGVDWTSNFRKSPRLEEYLLLGPCDTGLTGDYWRTWGAKPPVNCKDPPPFVQDGWYRTDMHDLSCHLISKDDHSNEYFNSSVVSFRRCNPVL